MSKHTNTDTGKPGTKHQEGTGIPTQINDDSMQRSDDLTERYTDDDMDIKEGVRELHPNRNENKFEGR